MERWQIAGFGLYVHWPFCQSKCPYCDFNSHVSDHIDHDRWLNAYVTEMRRYAEETPGRVLSSIFFGGGTPSLMRPRTVAAIIDEASKLWTPANDIEITLEANPTSVEISRFRDFRTAGVNRVSVGVQALNDVDLRRLGRLHGEQEARRAIATSQSVFEKTSFDLIYARQDQSLDQWKSELTSALALADGHLSLYQLTIEPGTVFAARFDRGQLRGLPVEDVAADMYDLTQEVCTAHGYSAYEVSNHAKPGQESRHNKIYWRCGDYVGIGPGAHGRITTASGQRFSTVRPSSPNAWLDRGGLIEDGDHDTLSLDDRASELIMMGLRVTEGVDLGEYEELTGASLSKAKVKELCDLGLVETRDNQIRTTAAGRLVLNWVVKQLLVG